ncbi:MAG: hypothetical protein QME52_13950 [Bacteroidota bacterium]|nr:hypothetical protein [Bacteroidota bacterium]
MILRVAFIKEIALTKQLKLAKNISMSFNREMPGLVHKAGSIVDKPQS